MNPQPLAIVANEAGTAPADVVAVAAPSRSTPAVRVWLTVFTSEHGLVPICDRIKLVLN